MLVSKKVSLRPLFESTGGVHLTVYLANEGNIIDLKKQLKQVIKQSSELLNSVMSFEERSKFLEPITALLFDIKLLKQMKKNIGIFRNENSFRLLNIPMEVDYTFQVATSFHVKPLIKWLQNDQEFLFLGLTKESASLYLGNQESLTFVDSILFPEAFKDEELLNGRLSLREVKKHRIKEDEAFFWLNEWISRVTQNSKPILFLAGEKPLVEALNRNLKYKNVIKTPVSNTFIKDDLSRVCVLIRKTVKDRSKKLYEEALQEFRFAELDNRTCKNIFQISKAVVLGQVRKLIVTDELSVFGKIDKKSGEIKIHPFDLDHEDDDVLDDLAQMVLAQGGEVVVASRNEIPKGRPILAILDHDGEKLERSKGLRLRKQEMYYERFA